MAAEEVRAGGSGFRKTTVPQELAVVLVEPFPKSSYSFSVKDVAVEQGDVSLMAGNSWG